jgi:hypothetical protein
MQLNGCGSQVDRSWLGRKLIRVRVLLTIVMMIAGNLQDVPAMVGWHVDHEKLDDTTSTKESGCIQVESPRNNNLVHIMLELQQKNNDHLRLALQPCTTNNKPARTPPLPIQDEQAVAMHRSELTLAPLTLAHLSLPHVVSTLRPKPLRPIKPIVCGCKLLCVVGALFSDQTNENEATKDAFYNFPIQS